MTLNELMSMRPLNNRVIIKPLVDTTKVRHGSLELSLGMTPDGGQFDEFKTAPVVCSVVIPPKRLIAAKRKVVHESVFEMDTTEAERIRLFQMRLEAKFTEATTIDKLVPNSLQWHTKVNIKEGDTVWVNANFFFNARERGDIINADGQVYYYAPYDALYLKSVDGVVTMLNGYVLAEVIDDTPDWTKRAEKAGLVVPDTIRKNYTDRVAIVRYIGEPVDYVMNDRYDHPEIKQDDVVLLTYKVNRRLEPGQRFFAKDNADLIVTRRCNIMGIFE